MKYPVCSAARPDAYVRMAKKMPAAPLTWNCGRWLFSYPAKAGCMLDVETLAERKGSRAKDGEEHQAPEDGH